MLGLEEPLVAYCVEKLVIARISFISDEMPRSISLFLLSRVSAEIPKFSRKGVFQHNRPKADFGSCMPAGSGKGRGCVKTQNLKIQVVN